MLSIGKLAPAQARYYLDQAEGRVDVVDSVAEGIEEYYVGGHEARGEWVGVGSRRLGLAGAVDGEALRAVLSGADPRDGRALRRSSSPARVGGFDLTFSAPKSVSVLFGVADASTREEVRAAHDYAAREALAYLERSSAAVRRGHGGAVVEQVDGFVAAAFRHRTSRVGDPQLHTHVLVANLARGRDGRWSALDGRQLYAHARTASFVYQAVLRGELTRRLGVEWTAVRHGIAEIVGVRRPVLEAFSRRRAEIEAAMEERGTAGARAAEAAALATRRPKEGHIRAVGPTVEWRQRAAAHGLGDRELTLLLGNRRRRELTASDWERAATNLARPIGLTFRSPTFSREEALRGFCEALPAGAHVDAALLEAATERFLQSSNVVPLLESEASEEVFRRRDGRTMPAAVRRLRYSTPAQLKLERQVIEGVMSARGSGRGLAHRDEVKRVLAARPILSDEQRWAIDQLCRSGDGVSVLAGQAGTGKTFVLGAAREAWQAAGRPVLGVATARRAALGLQEGAGIASTSTAALLTRLASGDGSGLPERCVLVVDEAGMASTRDIAQLLGYVDRAGGKLVLVGDDRQLPELAAGGTFHGLVRRGLAIELTENVRQAARWERDALSHLREGRAAAALELYSTHRRISIHEDADVARDAIVRDWHDAGDLDGTVMLAHRRIDVADLNERARRLLVGDGHVGGPELHLPGGDFAKGDRVVVRRNVPRLGLTNGDRGRVVEIQRDSLVIRTNGRDARLDRQFLLGATVHGEPTLVHGYAITAHVAQGITVDRAFVLAGEAITREWAYVAMSRGRTSNQLYLARAGEDARAEFAPTSPSARPALERLAEQLKPSRAQVLALDTGSASERLANAVSESARAERLRREVERRPRWQLGRHRQLEHARADEAAAGRSLDQLRRAAAESAHSDLPFIAAGESDGRQRALHDRIQERAHERLLRHGRGIERDR